MQSISQISNLLLFFQQFASLLFCKLLKSWKLIILQATTACECRGKEPVPGGETAILRRAHFKQVFGVTACELLFCFVFVPESWPIWMLRPLQVPKKDAEAPSPSDGYLKKENLKLASENLELRLQLAQANIDLPRFKVQMKEKNGTIISKERFSTNIKSIILQKQVIPIRMLLILMQLRYDLLWCNSHWFLFVYFLSVKLQVWSSCAVHWRMTMLKVFLIHVKYVEIILCTGVRIWTVRKLLVVLPRFTSPKESWTKKKNHEQ